MTQAEYDEALIKAWRADCQVWNFIDRIGGFEQCAELRRAPPCFGRVMRMPVRAFVAKFLGRLSTTLWNLSSDSSRDHLIVKNLGKSKIDTGESSMARRRVAAEMRELEKDKPLLLGHKIWRDEMNARFRKHRRSEQWNVCK